MSLSGLDDPAIEAVYSAAVNDGQWFWLKYTARDELALLAHGSDGVEAMRNTAQLHAEKNHGRIPSPLFGLIVFKRRKLLVKLILEDSSRLIQGRFASCWLWMRLIRDSSRSGPLGRCRDTLRARC
jgi:hypothetical protein